MRRGGWDSGWPRPLATTTGGRIIVIGHRATFYALEHLLKGIPLRDVDHGAVAVAAGLVVHPQSRVTGE